MSSILKNQDSSAPQEPGKSPANPSSMIDTKKLEQEIENHPLLKFIKQFVIIER